LNSSKPVLAMLNLVKVKGQVGPLNSEGSAQLEPLKLITATTWDQLSG
jgi:hypothetical protein